MTEGLFSMNDQEYYNKIKSLNKKEYILLLINSRKRIRQYFLIFLIGMLCAFILGLLVVPLNIDNSINIPAYRICNSFNFLAYLHAETIRHYQNATFEYSILPNCDVYISKSYKASLTYNEFLSKNNLTHIDWENKTNG